MDVIYLKLAIEGIQKYICSTGKLKEMIGGSEIIAFLASQEFYEPILADLGLEEDRGLSGAPGKYIVAQASAGALCLIMPDLAKAREFMQLAAQALLSGFPGLPFFGDIQKFAWSDDVAGREAYANARKRADENIARQRNVGPVPAGSGLLPILRAARLDGMPAVARPDNELISLPSLARRNPEMIARSRQRLHARVKSPKGFELEWSEDLEQLLGGQGGKVALICMDGNDLGKLFGAELKASSGLSLCAYIRKMKELSQRVESCNRIAFNHASERIAEYEAIHGVGNKITMPLRPLVMGGDDITIIARADIALPFIDMFIRKFDEVGEADSLSIGIDMVVMDSSYPFAKAFPLAESLQDSAKNLTRHLEPGQRPSSLDYLVLTEDVENNIDAVRQRLFTCPSGEILTSKPFVMKGRSFAEFLNCGCAVTASLPRSQVREAWTLCRKGPAAVKRVWLNLKENISRGIGGRKGRLMAMQDFLRIFPENFFSSDRERTYTRLGDYLELERLLPGDSRAREALLAIMNDEPEKDKQHV